MTAQKDNEETLEGKGFFKEDHILTIFICALFIPLSMPMWIANTVYSKLILHSEAPNDQVVISSARWQASCLISLSIAVMGYRKKSLNVSGALLGFFVGFILTLSNYCFSVALFTFFFTSSKATKLYPHLKRKFDGDFKEGGQRRWRQVLCNLDVGASERPIDFVKDYKASWLSMGVLGIFACCNGDTWASELGTVISKSDPYLVTSWKKVPKGTNGGISAVGTLFSALGGFFIGLAYYLAVLYFTDSSVLANAPPQWPLIICGTIAGFVGSLIDSILGASLQYSGLDKDGKTVSGSRLSVKHISGKNILDNHSVNLICTVIMGLLTPTISKYMWPV